MGKTRFHVEVYNPAAQRWMLLAACSDREMAEGLYRDTCLDYPRRAVRLTEVLDLREAQAEGPAHVG